MTNSWKDGLLRIDGMETAGIETVGDRCVAAEDQSVALVVRAALGMKKADLCRLNR